MKKSNLHTLLLALATLALAGTSTAQSLPQPLPQKFPAAASSNPILTLSSDTQITTIAPPTDASLPPAVLPAPLGNSFTLALWFQATDAQLLSTTAQWGPKHPMTLAYLTSADQQHRFLIRLNKSIVTLAAFNNTSTSWVDVLTSYKLAPNKWYSLVIVKNPGLTQVYINGTLAAYDATIPDLPKLDRIQYVRYGSNRFFAGEIAQPRIYNTALNLAQIKLISTTPPRGVSASDITAAPPASQPSYNKYPFLMTTPDSLHPLIEQLHLSATALPPRPGEKFPDLLIAGIHPHYFGWRAALYKPTAETTAENLPIYDNGTTLPLHSSEFRAVPIPGNSTHFDLFARGYNTPFGKQNLIHYTGTSTENLPSFSDPKPLLIDGKLLAQAFQPIGTVSGWFIGDLDGDNIPDLLVSVIKSYPPNASYWPDNRSPWRADELPNTGKDRGYDIAGQWLGNHGTSTLQWAKGLPRKNPLDAPSFTSPKPVHYQHLGFSVQLKSFEAERALLATTINGTPTLIHTGNIDQILALPYQVKNGEIITQKSRPLLANGNTTLRETYFPGSITLFQQNQTDGTTTLLLDGNPGRLAFLRGNSIGNFTELQPAQTKGGPLATDALVTPTRIDWNGDGLPDIITGDCSGYLILWPGTKDPLSYGTPINFTHNGTIIQHQANYGGSIQGPSEARWGYLQPNAGDWDEDGDLEILTNDIHGILTLYKKTTTGNSTDLTPSVITKNGEPYRIAWRSRPAILSSKYNYLATNRPGIIHLDWDGDLAIAIPTKTGSTEISVVEKLKYADGNPIRLCGPNGFWGRTELTIADWNNDGTWDIVFGCHISLPQFFTDEIPSGASPYFLENIGTNSNPKFAKPVAIRLKNGDFINLDVHIASAYPTRLSNPENPDEKPDLIIGAEDGKIYYFKRSDLK